MNRSYGSHLMWKWPSENAKIYSWRVEAGGVMEEDRGGVVGTLVCLSIWSIAIKINLIIINKIIIIISIIKILPYIAHLRMAYWLGILSASIIRIAYPNYIMICFIFNWGKQCCKGFKASIITISMILHQSDSQWCHIHCQNLFVYILVVNSEITF